MDAAKETNGLCRHFLPHLCGKREISAGTGNYSLRREKEDSHLNDWQTFCDGNHVRQSLFLFPAVRKVCRHNQLLPREGKFV